MQGGANLTLNSLLFVQGKSPGVQDLGFFACLIFLYTSNSVISGGVERSFNLACTLSGSKLAIKGLNSGLISAKCSAILSAPCWSVNYSSK